MHPTRTLPRLFALLLLATQAACGGTKAAAGPAPAPARFAAPTPAPQPSRTVPAKVGKDTLVYHWATGEERRGTLRAGRPLTIIVTGLNPLCYQTTVDVSVVEAKPDTKDFMAVLIPKTTEKSAAEKAEVKDPAPKASPPQQLNLMNNRGARPAAATQRAIASLDEAVDEMQQAASALREAKIVTDAGAKYAKTLSSPPCERSWLAEQFLAEVDAERGPLLSRLETAAQSISKARGSLAQARELLDEAADAGGAAAASLLIKPRRAELEKLEETAQTLAAAVPEQQAALRTLPTFREYTALATSVDASHDAEHLKLDIRSVRRAGVEGPEEPITVTRSPRVARRIRHFVTTGVLMSGIDPRDYERVNRPVVKSVITVDSVSGRADTAVVSDSTYSTFADQSAALLDVFSPVVQYNASVAGWSGLDVLGSFGLAARTVNGATRPEPLIGISLGITDRLLITGGYHWGRQETLRITRPDETAEDVATRPVPAAITDKDAIGVDWTDAMFFSVSVRP